MATTGPCDTADDAPCLHCTLLERINEYIAKHPQKREALWQDATATLAEVMVNTMSEDEVPSFLISFTTNLLCILPEGFARNRAQREAN